MSNPHCIPTHPPTQHHCSPRTRHNTSISSSQRYSNSPPKIVLAQNPRAVPFKPIVAHHQPSPIEQFQLQVLEALQH